MHLDGLEAAASDAITEGNADVRVTTWIDDEELHAVVRPLGDGVDEFAFVVRLEEAGLHAGLLRVRGNLRFEVG